MGKEEEKKLAPYMSAVEKIKPLLQDGKCARMADLTDDEREAIYDLHLLTIKPQIFVCNIDESTIESGTNKYVEAVKKIAAEEKSEVVVICGKFEADLSEITDEAERKEFMESVGLKESGLTVLARQVYHLMGLRTFFAAHGQFTPETRRHRQQESSTPTLKRDSSRQKPTPWTICASTAAKKKSRKLENTARKEKNTSYRMGMCYSLSLT